HAGLGARFLLAMPPRKRRVWSELELPEDLLDRYRSLMRGLLGLELADAKKRNPHILGLSSAAKSLWVEFFDEWGGVQFLADGEQASAFAKLEAYAPRLAALHHVVSHVAAGTSDLCPITAKSMQAAITLARWFAYELTRVYSMLRESDEERQARTLVEY